MQYSSSLQQNGSLECKRRWGNSPCRRAYFTIKPTDNWVRPQLHLSPSRNLSDGAACLSGLLADGCTAAMCHLVPDQSSHSVISIWTEQAPVKTCFPATAGSTHKCNEMFGEKWMNHFRGTNTAPLATCDTAKRRFKWGTCKFWNVKPSLSHLSPLNVSY